MYFAPGPRSRISPKGPFITHSQRRSLSALVTACHDAGIRFIIDVVMAFGTRAPLENINFDDFHIHPPRSPGDPDTQQSGGQGTRDAFGGTLWRYAHRVSAYDPLDGTTRDLVPARQLMKAYLLRWMEDFAVDGIRMDSVNNVANWDFVQEYKDLARRNWEERGGLADRFIVVGEELSVPIPAHANRSTACEEKFKRMVRHAILGGARQGTSSNTPSAK